MKIRDLLKKRHKIKRQHITALLAVIAVSLTGFTATSWAEALYILTGAENTAVILDDPAKTPDFSSQLLYVTSGASGFDVTLTPGRKVTVRHNDAVITTTSNAETVSRLLARLGITPSPFEMIGADLTSGSELHITVAEDIVYYDTVKEVIPFETRRIPTENLPVGAERVVQEGRDGLRTMIYEIVWSNGEQVSRQLVDQTEEAPVAKTVEYGTAATSVSRDDALADIIDNGDGSGTLVFASGVTMKYSSTRAMTATAYTTGYDGVGTITASGTVVHVGSVAVDPRVIPLGTRLYVVTDDGIVYGYSVAEDTGYSIKGDKIDLFYNTFEECVEFGRRPCTVYILK